MGGAQGAARGARATTASRPHTEDHPIEYLDFHGEIPKGNYGAGTMTIWDHGTYEILKWEPRKVEVALHGERLNARYALFAIDKEDPPKDWMVHRMDPPADAGARADARADRADARPRRAELPRDDDGWGFEIKWDGVRAIAYCAPGEVRLESRNLKEITDSYPELGRLDRALGLAPGGARRRDRRLRRARAARASGACSSACTSPRASRRGAWRRTRPSPT